MGCDEFNKVVCTEYTGNAKREKQFILARRGRRLHLTGALGNKWDFMVEGRENGISERGKII